MGRIVITEFVSLDGVIEAPGGGEGFKYDGWSFEIDRGDDGNTFKLEETMASEALLLGRTTYEGFAAAWPERDGEFADKFNTMPKYVVSSTLKDPTWNNSQVVGGYDPETIRKLKDELDGDLYTSGSITLVRAMLDDGLIDGLHLFVYPLTRGDGPRLFPEGAAARKLELAKSETYDNGVQYLNYRPLA